VGLLPWARTQIYVEEAESAVLDEQASRTGLTRSQLIREAIRARFLGTSTPHRLADVLRATAGTWHGRRPTGAQVVARLRRGRLSAIHAERS
jgi:hypothetical protein